MDQIPAYSSDQDTESIPAIVNDSTSTSLPPALAEDRAKKANFGLQGKIQESYNDLYMGLLNGKENELRDSAARQIAFQNTIQRNTAITAISNKLNRPLDQSDVDTIDNRLSHPDDPSSVFEDHFAKKYMDHMDYPNNDPDSTSILKDANNTNPNGVRAYKQVGENLIATRELINTRLQNVVKDIEDESTLRSVYNAAKTMIPGYSDVQLRGNIEGAGFSIGLGGSLEEQSIKFYSMSRPDQISALDKIHDNLKANPHIEAQFLSSLLGQSTQDRFVNNLMLPVDIATLGGFGIARKVGEAALPQIAIKNTVSNLVRSVDQAAADIAAPAAAGDIATASLRRATDDIVAQMTENDPRRRLVEGMWSFFNKKVEDLYKDPGNFGAEGANQLKDMYQVFGDSVDAILSSRVKNERTPFLRALEGILKDGFQEYIKSHFPSIDNKILDVQLLPDKSIANTWHTAIHLGDQYGRYFDTPEAAEFFAKRIHTFKDFDILGSPVTFEDKIARLDVPVTSPAIKSKSMSLGDTGPITPDKATDAGSGYYIRLTLPFKETSSFTRDNIAKAIETNSYGSNTPQSLVNYFIGGLRSPEDTMSVYANMQRGIATFGPNVLNKIAIQLGKDVQELAKGAYPFSAQRQKWKDWNRVVDMQRNLWDIETKSPGRTFASPGELESVYQSLIGRLPDAQEVKAYFSLKQLNELDWTLRNLSVYRNKARTGAMQHSLRLKDENGNVVNSPYFDAIPLEKIPTSDGNVLIMGKELGQEQIATTRALREDTDIGNILRTGRNKKGQLTSKPQVVQIYDELDNPLKGFGTVKDQRIRYVVGNFERKNLDFKQLPEKGGGHFIYEYPHYIKQATIKHEVDDKGALKKVHYEGDKTLWAIRTKAEGKVIEQRLNDFRQLIRDSKFDEAKEYLKNNPLGYNYRDIYEMFKPDKGVARIDVNEPIRLMDNNRTIGDAFENEYRSKYGKKFVNGLKSGNPASQYQVAFTGERDVRELQTILDRGSKGNPIFNVEPAKMLDTITSMNRSLANISNSFYFDDLKLGFMEHWLQEAKPYLNLRKNDIQNQAFSLFHNPPYIKGNRDQMERIKQLELARQQHLQLVMRPSQQESYLMSAAQRMSDAMYKYLGPDKMIEPLSMYSMMRDAPTFLRGMAFHFKLGMFNPAQLLKQMNTWATIYGIEGPQRASQGAAAAYMYQLSKFNRNPEILDGMSKILEKFGWRPGEFQEYANLLSSTGFETVAGEYAARDNIWSGSVYSNGKQRFLSLGSSFFTEGERNVRYGAMATAYRRFRDINPTGALSDANKEEILQRARLLNVNMDRAANSIFQHGLGSIPLQFQTYALRTAELMFGKRLTAMEKARLFGTYSTLYGLPVGATLFGLPIGDEIRKQALDNGYTVGDNYITGTLMEGVPSMIMQMVTGNTYNIGQAYGQLGMNNLSEMLRSDTTMWQVILGSAMGPSGSILMNTWANSDPLRRWMMNIYTDGYNTNWEDVARLFKEISSIRRGDEARMALETGNWYSKKGSKLDTDVNPLDALWMFASGLDHQRVSDAYLGSQNIESRKEYNKYTEELFIERLRKGIELAQAGVGYNPSQADKYFSDSGNVLKMRAYPIEDYAQLYARALDGYETLVDKIDRSYNLTHVPAGLEEAHRQSYIRAQELKQQGYK